jgi:hypothetical protein
MTHRNAHNRAAPVVSDVLIIGEAIVGGTLNGSYIYENAADNPEGASLYSWTVGDDKVSTTIELRITDDYIGKDIVFTVTPVAQSGETGRPMSSESRRVEVGFQNISDEENANSFMKQHGNFSFYTPEPSDRIFVSTGGAFSLIDAGTRNVYVRGQDDYGAVVPDSIATYLINNPASVLYSTERDFAALVPLGRSNQLLIWGKNMPVGQDLTKLRNIRAVYSNGGAFAYIYNEMSADNKWLGAIGGAKFGGQVPDSIHLKLVNDPPRAVYATFDAFAVLTEGGRVYAWGNAASGGTIESSAQALLEGMTTSRIVTNMAAFCAIDDTGSFATWGNAEAGGTIPADKLENILDDDGVKSIVAAHSAFCAITNGRAKAVSWGKGDGGGTMNAGAAELAARGNIVMCKAVTWAFCMINAIGQADAWGYAPWGGTIPPSDKRTPFAGVGSAPQGCDSTDMGVLMNSAHVKSGIRKIFTDKMTRAGIDTSDKEAVERASERLSRSVARIGNRIIIEDGYVSVYGNDSSFFLMAQDEEGFSNQILVWGQANGGGVMRDDTREALMASQITSVYCTNGAYGVIANQGRVEGVVTVWGATLAQLDAGEIPTTPPEIKEKLSGGIIEIYSIKRQPAAMPVPVRPPVDPSFAARHRDGSYVLWGGNVENQVFIPAEHESHTRARPWKSKLRRTDVTHRYSYRG